MFWRTDNCSTRTFRTYSSSSSPTASNRHICHCSQSGSWQIPGRAHNYLSRIRWGTLKPPDQARADIEERNSRTKEKWWMRGNECSCRHGILQFVARSDLGSSLQNRTVSIAFGPRPYGRRQSVISGAYHDLFQPSSFQRLPLEPL